MTPRSLRVKLTGTGADKGRRRGGGGGTGSTQAKKLRDELPRSSGGWKKKPAPGLRPVRNLGKIRH